jgi:hypothetical protein
MTTVNDANNCNRKLHACVITQFENCSYPMSLPFFPDSFSPPCTLKRELLVRHLSRQNVPARTTRHSVGWVADWLADGEFSFWLRDTAKKKPGYDSGPFYKSTQLSSRACDVKYWRISDTILFVYYNLLYK